MLQADFNSRYLLSLVRHIKLSNDPVNNTPLQNVLMAVTAGESPSDSSPSLGRLIRNHADLISRLRLAHVSEFEARYRLMESVSLPEDMKPLCHRQLKRFPSFAFPLGPSPIVQTP